MREALVVIDVQNDYFPGGRFPLWNPEAALAATEDLLARATRRQVPIVLVQHLAAAGRGSPLLEPGTVGAELHPRLLAAAPSAPVVVKSFADAFDQTALEETLAGLGVDALVLAGMMTHHCVTHTSLSRAADRYRVSVAGDACATVSELLHRLALGALGRKVRVVTAADAL